MEGDISAIKVSEPAMPERRDYLWQTTCFEIFWQPVGESRYCEFNLSPSTCWAAYDFDDIRLNARNASVDSIAIASVHNQREMALRASIMANLPGPAKAALNVIVENVDGSIQFWALAFPDGKPDFHSEVCRRLTVEQMA